KVLTSAEDQAFVSIREGGEVLAIARLSLAGGWGDLAAVEVNPGYRRQGLGAAITAAACEQAARCGLTRVFLQVEVDNNAAQALYRGLGFRYAHRYHYRVAPPKRQLRRHAGPWCFGTSGILVTFGSMATSRSKGSAPSRGSAGSRGGRSGTVSGDYYRDESPDVILPTPPPGSGRGGGARRGSGSTRSSGG